MTLTVPFLTSTDGVNWIPRPGPISTVINADRLVWDQVNNLFITIAADGLANNYCIFTSPDGITWTERLVNNDLMTLATDGSGYTIALGWYLAFVWYSSDGVTWTSAATTGTSVPLADRQEVCCWDGHQFLGLTGPSQGIHTTSPDGITWTQHGAGADIGFPIHMASNGSLTVAGGTAASYSGPGDVRAIEISTDGITWTRLNTPFDNGAISFVTWGDEWMVGGATANAPPDSRGRVATSPDGVTWTLQTTPEDGPDSISIGAGYSSTLGQWVLNGVEIIPPATTEIALLSTSSDDGVTWAGQSNSGMLTNFFMTSPMWSPVANIWVIGGTMNFPDPPQVNPPVLTLTPENVSTVQVDWATTPQTLYGSPVVVTTHISHYAGATPPPGVEFVTAATPGTVTDTGLNLLKGEYYQAYNSSPGFPDSTLTLANFVPTSLSTLSVISIERNPISSATVTLTVTVYSYVNTSAAQVASYEPDPFAFSTQFLHLGNYLSESLPGGGFSQTGGFQVDDLVPSFGVAHYTTVPGDLLRTRLHPVDTPVLASNISFDPGLPYTYDLVYVIFDGAYAIQTAPFRISYLEPNNAELFVYSYRGVIEIGAAVQRRSAVPDKRQRAVPGSITMATSDSGVPSSGGSTQLGAGTKRSSSSLS